MTLEKETFSVLGLVVGQPPPVMKTWGGVLLCGALPRRGWGLPGRLWTPGLLPFAGQLTREARGLRTDLGHNSGRHPNPENTTGPEARGGEEVKLTRTQRRDSPGAGS